MCHRFHKVGRMRRWAFLHCRDTCEMEANLTGRMCDRKGLVGGEKSEGRGNFSCGKRAAG